jgi:hypothetical protein
VHKSILKLNLLHTDSRGRWQGYLYGNSHLLKRLARAMTGATRVSRPCSWLSFNMLMTMSTTLNMLKGKDLNPTPDHLGLVWKLSRNKRRSLMTYFASRSWLDKIFTRAGFKSFLQARDRHNATLEDIPGWMGIVIRWKTLNKALHSTFVAWRIRSSKVGCYRSCCKLHPCFVSYVTDLTYCRYLREDP